MRVFIVAGVVLAVVLLIVFGRSRGLRRAQMRPGPDAASPGEVYAGLRDQALHAFRATSHVPNPSTSTEPIAVVMDLRVHNGTATVAAYNDGTASIYLSSGGGFIGGSQSHESIRKAALTMISTAGEFLPTMNRVDEFPLPGAGQTNFYVVTTEGAFFATALEDDLGNGRVPLSKLFYAGQGIITEYRLIQPN